MTYCTKCGEEVVNQRVHVCNDITMKSFLSQKKNEQVKAIKVLQNKDIIRKESWEAADKYMARIVLPSELPIGALGVIAIKQAYIAGAMEMYEKLKEGKEND